MGEKTFLSRTAKNVNVFILNCEEDTKLYLIMNNHWRSTYNYSGARLLRGVALLLLLRVTRLLLRVAILLLGVGRWLHWVVLLLLLEVARRIGRLLW